MRVVSWFVRAVLVAVALSAASGVTPHVAMASWPTEPPATILPGATIQAVAIDLDGDGAREIARLTTAEEDPQLVHVEVWRQSRAVWERAGEPRRAARVATEEELAYLRRGVLDEQGLLALLLGEPARLIVWHEDGEERLVLATSAVGDSWWVPCCMTLSAVTLGEDGLELTAVSTDTSSGDSVVPVDLDADGTDELVISEPAQSSWSRRPGAPARIRAYRWDGERFTEAHRIDLARSSAQTPFVLGDTDGRPGSEIGLADPGGGGVLVRIGLDGSGALVADTAELDLDATDTLSATALATDPVTIAAVADDVTLVVHWPLASSPRVVRSHETGGRLLGTLGTGDAAQVFVADPGAGLVHLLGTSDRGAGSVPPSDEAAALMHGPLTPWAGRLSDVPADGSQAIVYAGHLFVQPPDGDAVSFTDIAPLAAAQPIGVVGSGGSTIAVVHGAPLGLDRNGGRLRPTAVAPDARIAIVAADAMLSAAPPAGGPSGITVVGASTNREDGAWAVVTSAEGFSIVVDAPPDSRAHVIVGERPLERRAGQDLVVPPSGHLEIDVTAEMLPDGDEPVNAQVVVTTPVGRAQTVRGSLSVMREPPGLSLESPFAPLAFDVPLNGVTAPGARVFVNGDEVAVDASGGFSSRVPAALWPTDVRVEALDAVGNRSTETIAVVAIVDYRQLPWIPIALVATVVAGLVLAWRAPSPPAAPRPAAAPPEGGAVLEEVES